MKNTTHKVVILENLSSPYIEQAIIVLKNNSCSNESKVMLEAERVVNDYLKKNKNTDRDMKIYTNKNKSKPSLKSVLIYSVTVIAAVLLAVALS